MVKNLTYLLRSLRGRHKEEPIAMRDGVDMTKPENKVIRGTKLPPQMYDPKSRPDLDRKL